MWPKRREHKLFETSVYLTIIFILLISTMAVQREEDFAARLNIFANEIFKNIRAAKPAYNIVISPLSVQTCGAMLRVGAENETAKELDTGLGLKSSNLTETVEEFRNILEKYENSKILRLATRIYVNKDYFILKTTNQMLQNMFFADAFNVDFSNNQKAAAAINEWVKERTNELIIDLVPPSVLNSQTRLLIVNAIHFKGNWKHKFPETDTAPDNFYTNKFASLKVPMMYLKARLHYADLPQLNATALKMPYADTDFSMLIILPNERDGISALLENLKSLDIGSIQKEMNLVNVILKFPKFKIEFEIELTEPFKKLGMTRLFTDKAELGALLEGSVPVKVSKILHKAVIEVNEDGTEAAAATAVKSRQKRGLDPSKVEFFANHPFVFFIINDDSVNIFMGTYENPNNPTASKHDEL